MDPFTNGNDEEDDDEFMKGISDDEDEEETQDNFNTEIASIKSLNDAQDRIVKLMEYSRDIINFIQSPPTTDIMKEETDLNKQVQQYLDEIKEIKTIIAQHIVQVSRLPVITYETNVYQERKQAEIREQKAQFLPDHKTFIDQLINQYND